MQSSEELTVVMTMI